MDATANQEAAPKQKPFAVWVIVGGLVLTAALTLALGALGYVSNGDLGQFASTLIFVLVLVIPAVFAWKEKRGAYLGAAVVSSLLFVLFLLFSAASLTNPADSAFDVLTIVLPIFLLVAAFGIQAFRNAKTGLRGKGYLATARSMGGLLTFAVVGFIVGLLVAGTIGAGVILRSAQNGTADIKIVSNAATAAVPYSPAVFTTTVGSTVTWINVDTTAHTVTSNTTGQFDSGTLSTGQTWSHTFTLAGTYHYYCAIHPMMTGTVVVTGP